MKDSPEDRSTQFFAPVADFIVRWRWAWLVLMLVMATVVTFHDPRQ